MKKGGLKNAKPSLSTTEIEKRRAYWRAKYKAAKERDPEGFKEKQRIKSRKKYLKNIDKQREKDRKRHAKNRDKNLERMRSYYRENKEKILARCRRNYSRRKTSRGLSKLQTLLVEGKISGVEFIRRYTNELVGIDGQSTAEKISRK